MAWRMISTDSVSLRIRPGHHFRRHDVAEGRSAMARSGGGGEFLLGEDFRQGIARDEIKTALLIEHPV